MLRILQSRKYKYFSLDMKCDFRETTGICVLISNGHAIFNHFIAKIFYMSLSNALQDAFIRNCFIRVRQAFLMYMKTETIG